MAPEGAVKQREDWRLTSGSGTTWVATVLTELGGLGRGDWGWLGVGVHSRVWYIKVDRSVKHPSGNIKWTVGYLSLQWGRPIRTETV